jgi:H+-transporting ATPase
MYVTKILKEGPQPRGKHTSLDGTTMGADGFAGVCPEHKYEVAKRLHGDAPALSQANVGIAVEGATDAARGVIDIVLTESSLSTIVHAIRGSHVIFRRIRNSSIYAYAVTIRIVVCFAILAFAYQFDFPLVIILVIALLTAGTIMTLSADCILLPMTPENQDSDTTSFYAMAYSV